MSGDAFSAMGKAWTFSRAEGSVAQTSSGIGPSVVDSFDPVMERCLQQQLRQLYDGIIEDPLPTELIGLLVQIDRQGEHS